MPGAIDVLLSDSRDIEIVCKMKSETQEIQATTAKEAVDMAVQSSTFGLNAGILLDLFLNAGPKFPFRLAEVTVGASFKLVPDLKLAYNSGKTATTGGTTTTTTVTSYKVTTPINGWTIVAN